MVEKRVERMPKFSFRYRDPKDPTNIIKLPICKPSPEALKTLSLKAQGHTYEEIGEQMEISRNQVKNRLSDARDSTSSTTTLMAIFACLHAGIEDTSSDGWLTLDRLLKNTNLKGFETLNEREGQIMSELIYDYGRFSTNEEIAQRLNNSSIDIVKRGLYFIYNKIGAKNREQAGVMCFAYAAITFGAIAFIKSMVKDPESYAEPKPVLTGART